MSCREYCLNVQDNNAHVTSRSCNHQPSLSVIHCKAFCKVYRSISKDHKGMRKVRWIGRLCFDTCAATGEKTACCLSQSTCIGMVKELSRWWWSLDAVSPFLNGCCYSVLQNLILDCFPSYQPGRSRRIGSIVPVARHCYCAAHFLPASPVQSSPVRLVLVLPYPDADPDADPDYNISISSSSSHSSSSSSSNPILRLPPTLLSSLRSSQAVAACRIASRDCRAHYNRNWIGSPDSICKGCW
jgi:hypothetical protein